MATRDAVLVEVVDDVAVITINRPDKLNALDSPTRIELAQLIRNWGDGDRAIGLVVTGAGRAFCAGDDLSTLLTEVYDETSAIRMLEEFHDLTRAVLASEVPTIAAINGLAVGGAMEWCLSFDRRLGCSETVLIAPENRVGLTISNAASFLFPRMLRPADVTRLVLDSRALTSGEALELGLLDGIVERPELLKVCLADLTAWGQVSEATRLNRRLLRPDRASIEEAMRRETEAFAEAWASGVIQRGVEDFWRQKSSTAAGPKA